MYILLQSEATVTLAMSISTMDYGPTKRDEPESIIAYEPVVLEIFVP